MAMSEDEIVTTVEEYGVDEKGIRKDYKGRTMKEEGNKMVYIPWKVFKIALISTVHLKAFVSCGAYDLLKEKDLLSQYEEALSRYTDELDEILKEIAW